MADRPSARQTNRVLAAPTGRTTTSLGTTNRPSPRNRPRWTRRPVSSRTERHPGARPPGHRPSHRRNPVHDTARSIPDTTLTILRPTRHRSRLTHRRPNTPRTRRPHRILRQHPGTTITHTRRLQNPAGQGTRHHTRRLHPPRPTLRKTSRNPRPTTRPRTHTTVPGHVHPTEHTPHRPHTQRHPHRTLRTRHPNNQIRPHPDPHRNTKQHSRRLPRIRHRPLQRHHRRTNNRKPPSPPHRNRQQPEQ